MKKVFYITWAWYIACIYVKECIKLSPDASIWLGFFIVLNLAFVVILTCMFQWMFGRTTHTDVKYARACVATITSRLLVMGVAMFGLRDIHWLIICNGLAIAFYVMLKKYIQDFSDDRFIEAINDRGDNFSL